MMASEHIINVNESDFEYQVLAYSQQIPVVVDFWAEWCIPCRTLGPILEKLAQQAQGAFRLAKLNVDQNQRLAQRFNVRSIPAVKAFRDGKVVAEFTGVLPEPKVRAFLSELAPSDLDLALEKAASLYTMEQYRSAESTYREVLERHPGHSAALLGLAKCLLIQGMSEEALRILGRFPASHEYPAAESLMPLAAAMQRELGAKSEWSEDPLDAAYERALRLVGRGNLPAAMDGLLDILRANKRYRDDEARRVLLGLFEMLGEQNPLTKQYRQELAMVLF